MGLGQPALGGFWGQGSDFLVSQMVWEGPGFGGPRFSCSLRAVPDVLILTIQLFSQNVEVFFACKCVTLVRGEMKFGFPGGFSGVVRAVA